MRERPNSETLRIRLCLFKHVRMEDNMARVNQVTRACTRTQTFTFPMDRRRVSLGQRNVLSLRFGCPFSNPHASS